MKLANALLVYWINSEVKTFQEGVFIWTDVERSELIF